MNLLEKKINQVEEMISKTSKELDVFKRSTEKK
jgi:hypothetical protein